MRKHPVIQYVLANHFLSGILFLALVWFIVQTRGILATLFAAYILMAALLPIVRYLRAHKVPKIAAVLISYALVFTVVVVIVIPLIPFFATQVQQLYQHFPSYLDKAAHVFGLSPTSEQLSSFLQTESSKIGENALTATTWVFGGLFSLLSVLVISFYLMLDYGHIRRGVGEFLDAGQEKRLHATLDEIELRIGAWVRGQLLLCVSIAFCTWAALTIIGLDFALPLALMAGVLELVPTIGPILSSVPAIIVALTVSPTITVIVAISYFIIQMTENNVLVPKIMEKAVGLNPIVIILSVVLGGELMGLVGAFLAIPFILMLVIIFQSLRNE